MVVYDMVECIELQLLLLFYWREIFHCLLQPPCQDEMAVE